MTLGSGQFPLRENCDPTNPDEAFLWMFVALPGVSGGPLIMPIDYWKKVSRRLWELGARPVEEPELEWVPPKATDPNWITSPGSWVPAGSVTVTEEDRARDALERMTPQQRHELLTVLEAGEPWPDSPSGRVVQTLSGEQREIVLRVLRGC